jgi:c-di-GMP-binding flagellar brake protein YcgR
MTDNRNMMAPKRLSNQPSARQSSEQSLAGLKQKMAFDDLRLAVGERIRLETVKPRGRYSIRYLGAHSKRCLMVSMPVVNGTPKSIKEGAKIRLRLIALNKACAFTTRVLSAQLLPVPLLFLEYPGDIEAVVVRQALRINCQLIVSVDETIAGNFGSRWPRQALCCDISLHGCRIEAGDQLGEIGDSLYVTARVRIGEIDQVLLIEGVIRNMEEVEDSFNGFRMIHGLEFTGLDEDTQLILTGFVYQQMLREQVGL